MKIPCTINGKKAEIELPVSFVPRLALKKKEAAIALGVGQRMVWKLASLGKIAKTSYGTYPIASLQSHLANETLPKTSPTNRK